MKVIDSDKHYSLVGYAINYSRKKCFSTGHAPALYANKNRKCE